MSTVGPGIQLVTLALQAPSTPLTNPCPALLMAKSADTDGCLLLAHIDVERCTFRIWSQVILDQDSRPVRTWSSVGRESEAPETAVRDQMDCAIGSVEGICKSFVTQGISGRSLKFSLPVNQICTTKELEYMA